MLRTYHQSLERSAINISRCSWLCEVAVAISTALLSALLGALLLGYPETPISVPAKYSGDALFYGILFKGTLENGWYFDNPNIGAPFGLTMGPFPMVDASHFLMIRALGLFNDDYGSVFTWFILASFATAALSAYVVLRKIGIPILIACCGSILFSLQAYHFLRSGGHVFLASYFSIPIYVWFALRLYERPSFGSGWKTVLGLSGLLLLAVGSGVYYAFFGCVLIGFAAVSSSVDQARWRPMLTGLVLLGCIAAGVLVNLAPHIIYMRNHSADATISSRLPEESETYGLKPIQLVLPSPTHRQPAIHAWVTSYNSRAPLTNENATSSLGLLGTIGFLASITVFMLFRTRRFLPLVTRLGGFNIVLVAYATIGGIGSLVAWTITPQLRALNRLSIVIAFISLAALCVLLKRLFVHLGGNGKHLVFTTLAVCSIAMFGWWDQTPNWIPTLARVSQVAFDRDAQSGNELMRILGPGSRVYQMPYVAFPEAPANYQEGLYGLSRWYLHTHGIQWSYPAMKGSEADLWIRQIETLPLPKRLGTLSASGFNAVMVDRVAYADNAKAVEEKLAEIVGPADFVCADNSCALYRLSRGNVPATSPLILATLGNGWSVWETDSTGNSFVWSLDNRPSRIYLMNPLPTPTSSRIQLSVTPRDESEIQASLDGKTVTDWTLKKGEAGNMDLTVSLTPGISTLELKSSISARAASPTDPRIIGFELRNLTIQVIDPKNQP
jgi:hypothetical protein